MRTVSFSKAGPISGKEVESLELWFDFSIEQNHPGDCARYMESEGKALAAQLRATLPRGTLRHLTAELLRCCAGSFLGLDK